jgi:hypothetical protein
MPHSYFPSLLASLVMTLFEGHLYDVCMYAINVLTLPGRVCFITLRFVNLCRSPWFQQSEKKTGNTVFLLVTYPERFSTIGDVEKLCSCRYYCVCTKCSNAGARNAAMFLLDVV